MKVQRDNGVSREHLYLLTDFFTFRCKVFQYYLVSQDVELGEDCEKNMMFDETNRSYRHNLSRSLYCLNKMLPKLAF